MDDGGLNCGDTNGNAKWMDRVMHFQGEARRTAWLYTESEKNKEIKDGFWCVFVFIRKIDQMLCHFLT